MSKSKAQRQADATKAMHALPEFKQKRVALGPGSAFETFGDVADRLGKMAALRAEIEAYEEKLKAVIVELGEDAVEGALFRAALSVYPQHRLDTKAIRADMDEKWLAKYSLPPQTIRSVRVHARTGALANAA